MRKEGKGRKANPVPVVGVWQWRYWQGRAGGFKSYGSPSWRIMLHLSYLARGSTTRGDHWYALLLSRQCRILPSILYDWVCPADEQTGGRPLHLWSPQLRWSCQQSILSFYYSRGICTNCKQPFQNQAWVDMSSICFVCGCSRRLCVSNVEKMKVMTALWFKLLGTTRLAFYSTPGQERASSKWSAKCSSRSCCEL